MKHTALTNRRLHDGDRASGVSTTDEDLAKLSLPELLALKEVVFDGAVALQSLDDLGSPEANDAAWLQCIELDRKLERIKTEIEKRKAENTQAEAKATNGANLPFPTVSSTMEHAANLHALGLVAAGTPYPPGNAGVVLANWFKEHNRKPT